MGGRDAGPAEMARVEIYREIAMVAWWLSFTYYNMSTQDRQSQTGRGLSYNCPNTH